jgi:hypothetical protein
MAVVWCSIALSGGSSGDLDGNRLELRQSRVRPASTVATKTVMAANQNQAIHLRVDDTIGDVLKHPAFAGFARLLLPWDNRRYGPTLTLRRIGTLLPYHTHVDPSVVVASLNRMIDDVSAGRTVFYDIYTAGQKQAESSRKDTGLFFLRGKPGAPFAVIAPGGGFAYVGSLHEGFPYAVEISKLGYNAFVLKYRAGHGGTAATEDLAAALDYIFRNGARTRRQHGWLFAVGQLRGSENGGSDRLARHHTLWRFESPEASDRCHAVHRPFGPRVDRTSNVRSRG